MTRDDIIRMAREAGKVRPGVEYLPLEVFERFATAIAAAERQAIIDELQKWHRTDKDRHNYWLFAVNYIQGRGQQ